MTWIGLAPTLTCMEVHLSPDQEAELMRLAKESGRSADEFLRDLVDRYLAEEARFHAGVRARLEAAARGDFVETSEVWASVERVLKA